MAEELQMGITTGLALNGSIPVSIFPRWNFLMLAMNQLINHLDKINIMSNNGYIKNKHTVRRNNDREIHLLPPVKIPINKKKLWLQVFLAQ